MDGIRIRPATSADIGTIVAMLADDSLGATRETPDDLAPYEKAFAAIDTDPNQLLAVAERDGSVLGTFQLTYVPGLSRRGSSRAIIEAVRVAAAARGAGIGAQLMEWAIAAARDRGASLVQLTSDRTRLDAHRFYERLGFKPTHLGFKLWL